MPTAVAVDRAAVAAMGEALRGTGRPLVGVSGTLSLAPLGRLATEEDSCTVPGTRSDVERLVLELAGDGVRSAVVRVPPVVHSTLDRHGFARTLIAIASGAGVAAYAGDGTNRWPAVHTLDLARLFRLVLEGAPAGSTWHAVGDEGVPFGEIARSIGGHLGVPVHSLRADRLGQHFGFLGPIVALDNPTSGALTRARMGWEPTHPGLLADLDGGDYFPRAASPA